MDLGLAVRAGSLGNLATRTEYVRRYLVSPEKAQCESVSWVAAFDFDIMCAIDLFQKQQQQQLIRGTERARSGEVRNVPNHV